MTDKRAFTLSNPDGLGDPSCYAYSHLGIVPSGVTLVFVAGQAGPDYGAHGPPDFRAQCKSTLCNLRVAIAAVGGSLSDLVKLTILVVDLDDERHATLTEALNDAFGIGPKPTCTLIPVPRLASLRMQVEIEGIAALDDDGKSSVPRN